MLGLATAAISVQALFVEQSHLFASGSDQQDRVASFVDGSRQVGIATTTQRWFVIDCRNATIFAFSAPLPAETRNALALRCLTGALQITQSAPSSSFAWFGAAHASLALADWDGVRIYLDRSHASGAQEGWIARYRAELVADNYEQMSAANLQGFSQDLTILAGNMTAYATFLATQYQRHPQIRSLITDAVEQQSPADQQTFLGRLQSTSGARP